jgi:ribonuclease HI
MNNIDVWTDGACMPNPGRGGWAFCTPGGIQGSGAENPTTNQRMEMRAVIEALRRFDGASSIRVFTDSQFVINVCTKWRTNWKKRGWKKADGQPVKNPDLVLRLDELCEANRVTFQWVKGHDGDPMNELADRLSVEATGLNGAEIAQFEEQMRLRKSDGAARGTVMLRRKMRSAKP